MSPTHPLSIETINHRRSQHLNEFIQWLNLNGTKFSKIKLCSTDSMGYGASTLYQIDAKESTLTVPLDLIISVDTCFQCPILGEAFQYLKCSNELVRLDDRIVLYIFLVHEKYRGIQSKWFPYIQCLPEKIDCAVEWDKEMLEELKGIPLYQEVMIIKTKLEHIYEEILEKILFQQFPNLFSKEIYSLESIIWAYSIFWSRALQFSSDLLYQRSFSKKVMCQGLVPLIDILNHKPGTLSEWKKSGSIDAPSISVCYGKTINENQELFLNYGAKSNSELLCHYGFIIEDNQADTFHLQLDRIFCFESFVDIPTKVKNEVIEILQQKGIMVELTIYAGDHPLLPDAFDTTRSFCHELMSLLKNIENFSFSTSSISLFYKFKKDEDNQSIPKSYWDELDVDQWESMQIGTCLNLENEHFMLDFLVLFFNGYIKDIRGNSDPSKVSHENVHIYNMIEKYKKGLIKVLWNAINTISELKKRLTCG